MLTVLVFLILLVLLYIAKALQRINENLVRAARHFDKKVS